MTVTTTQTVSVRDREILRRLGERLAVLAGDPVMEERRRLWKAHSVLHSARPMLLAEISGVLDELIPLDSLTCESEWARGAERGLRARLFQAEDTFTWLTLALGVACTIWYWRRVDEPAT